MFLLTALLKSPAGTWAAAWAIGLLVLSATKPFRWSVAYAAGSVALLIGTVGLLIAIYAGVRDGKGDFIIEGPEFFGTVFAGIAGTIYAGSILGLGSVIALVRHHVRRRSTQELEQI